jgi:hypothetical protein
MTYLQVAICCPKESFGTLPFEASSASLTCQAATALPSSKMGRDVTVDRSCRWC